MASDDHYIPKHASNNNKKKNSISNSTNKKKNNSKTKINKKQNNHKKNKQIKKRNEIKKMLQIILDIYNNMLIRNDLFTCRNRYLGI